MDTPKDLIGQQRQFVALNLSVQLLCIVALGLRKLYAIDLCLRKLVQNHMMHPCLSIISVAIDSRRQLISVCWEFLRIIPLWSLRSQRTPMLHFQKNRFHTLVLVNAVTWYLRRDRSHQCLATLDIVVRNIALLPLLDHTLGLLILLDLVATMITRPEMKQALYRFFVVVSTKCVFVSGVQLTSNMLTASMRI
jgi:hypothetical protein